MIKKFIPLLLLLIAFSSQAQVKLFIGGNPYGANPIFNLHKEEFGIKEVKSYYFLLKLEQKVRLDKAISIGMMWKTMKFTLNSDWTSGTDWTTYCNDQGINIDKYATPSEINYDYIFVPIELTHYSRFFRFSYGIGPNFLVNKPYFDASTDVPIDEKYFNKVMLEQDFTIAYNKGNMDLSLTYNYLFDSFIVNPDYDVLAKVDYKPAMIAISMNYKLKVIKRKHV